MVLGWGRSCNTEHLGRADLELPARSILNEPCPGCSAGAPAPRCLGGALIFCRRPALPSPRPNSALIRGWISKAGKCPLSSLPQIYQLSFFFRIHFVFKHK